MIILVAILILTEVFSLTALFQHLSRPVYYGVAITHALLSVWMWILFFSFAVFKGPFDDPGQVWRLMMLAGMTCAVLIPRFLIIIFHFAGKLIMIRKGGHIRWLTNTGLAISAILFLSVAAGTIKGRFSFREENTVVKIRDLSPDLEGLRIVQISDLHLSSFAHHAELLEEVMKRVNDLKPDILINTGDFITFGWKEFGRNDTILAKARGKYGSFAIMGNHDAGTYHPDYSEADRGHNVQMMDSLVTMSGYTVLNNAASITRIENTGVALIGIITRGRHPDIVHGSIDEAAAGLDSAGLRILLTHDPNHWFESVKDTRPDILLTLSGHTHGMQMGIMTKKLKWSPSKYFFPHWNGLYNEAGQNHYVNRGLGVLAVPFRIWMPPEISVLTLQKE